MPGAYAHIAIVNDAQKRTDTVGLSDETAESLALYLKYIELGAVSPDYPYLAIGESKWADKMHYSNNSQLLRNGVKAVRGLKNEERSRATAWLMGFTAHMTTDMTIHPIVEAVRRTFYWDRDNRRC